MSINVPGGSYASRLHSAQKTMKLSALLDRIYELEIKLLDKRKKQTAIVKENME